MEVGNGEVAGRRARGEQRAARFTDLFHRLGVVNGGNGSRAGSDGFCWQAEHARLLRFIPSVQVSAQSRR